MNEALLLQFESRPYCQFHLPLSSDHKLGPDAFGQLIQEKHPQSGNDRWGNFRGVAFPGVQHYLFWGTVHLTECTIGPRVQLSFTEADPDLSGSTFESYVFLYFNGSKRRLVCRNSHALGDFESDFASGTAASSADFSGTEFSGVAAFRSANVLSALNFGECKFETAPTFGGSPKIPQNTNFVGATFGLKPDDEPAYRQIRNYYSDHRAREAEGRFYAYEKRCHRYKMRGWRTWAPRFISKMYDLTSEYGYSYGRALGWFVGVQIVFGLIYALISGRLWNIGGPYDSHVVGFTLAQLVKPFELFSSRLAHEGAYEIVDPHWLGSWQALTLLQSLLSIVLIALFLIAIRWRFRRE